jgi:hypothetical protein
LIVTATVPLEVTATDCVSAVPTETLPKAREVVFRLNAGVAAFNCSEVASDELPEVAVRVTACELLTDATFAVNAALVAVAGTVTELGTIAARLLLNRLTLTPPDGAAEPSDTMHVVVPAPVNELVPHDNALNVGAKIDADPLRLMDVVSETDPCVAVSVTVCDEVTAAIFAAKLTLVAPEGTVTETGTDTDLLLLARLTTTPVLGAGKLIVTVQLSVPAPFIEEFAQLRPDRETDAELDPLPCSFTTPPDLVDDLVIAVTLSCPDASVSDPGSNCTCTTMLPPAGSVLGSGMAFTLNALLELLNWVTSTGEVSRFVIETFL